MKDKNISHWTILTATTIFSLTFALACSSMSGRSRLLQSPRAKQDKLYRPCVGGSAGEWCSRYCKELKKVSGKCKEYSEEKLTNADWEFIKNANYALVPMSQL